MTKTLEDCRLEMNQYRRELDAKAALLKDSYYVIDKLRTLLTELDAGDREIAEQVLCEWLLSEDEGLRFDALSLVNDLKIGRAVPNLHTLKMRLVAEISPGAPYELKKVRRLLEALG